MESERFSAGRCERTESGERGLTGKYQLDEHKRRYDITSFHANAIPIEVIDRIPVPRNDEIKVELLEGATPPDVKDLDGMWVTTLAEIAGHTASTVQEIHTHARIDVPMFPGAGASFRPAQVRNPEPALNR